MSVSQPQSPWPQAGDSIFGRIVTGGDVEAQALRVLKRWSDTYLSELERQHGYERRTFPRVRAWAPAPTFDKWPEDQLPAVLLVSTGIPSPPPKRGGGEAWYRARWLLGLGVVCSARTQAQSHEQAMLYLAAHRMILVQRPSLEGYARGTVWVGESYDELEYDDTRSLGAGLAAFEVEVDNVASANAGPLTPDDPDWPYEPWARVETVEVDVEAVPITETVPLPGPHPHEERKP